MTLKDIPYEIAENAVMEHICTNIYPPNIAEIRKLCMERCKTPILSFDEAWGVVQKQNVRLWVVSSAGGICNHG